MAIELRRLTERLVRTGLRAAPWLVSVATVGFGSWLFSALMPVASDSRLAAVGIGVVLVRAIVAMAAVSAGSFAVASGLEGRWFPSDVIPRRRFVGLTALGATGMALGTYIIAGPLAGLPAAHSAVVVSAAGILAGLSAWSTWSLGRRALVEMAPALLVEPQPIEEWDRHDVARTEAQPTFHRDP